MDKQQREIGAYQNNRCLTGMIGTRGSHLIGARGYGSCLIGAKEIDIEMIQKIDSKREIGIEMVGARELGSCGSV